MTSSNLKNGVLIGPKRRRRRTPAEKLAIIAETYEPGIIKYLEARRHGIAPNPTVTWQRLASQSALTAIKLGEPVVRYVAKTTCEAHVRDFLRHAAGFLYGCSCMEFCERMTGVSSAGSSSIMDCALKRRAGRYGGGFDIFRPLENRFENRDEIVVDCLLRSVGAPHRCKLISPEPKKAK